MKRPFVRLFALSLVISLATAATAQMPVGVPFYDAGSMSFDYVQTPFPGYSGSFAAEGDGLAPDGTLPPGQTEAVGGAWVFSAVNDTVRTAWFAVVDNQDGTFDAALAAIATLDVPTPGTYPVDLENGTALFGFMDDAESFDLPDTLSQEALIDWLFELPAAHKLISTSGSITLAGVDPDTLHGTFSGTTVDLDNFLFFVNVSNGEFALSGGDPLADAPAAGLAPDLSAAPNPFNPQTEIRLMMPAAATARVAIHDLAGRHVAALHEGWLAEGPQRWLWDGRGDGGGRVAAGTYLVQARGSGWRTSTKVVLVP